MEEINSVNQALFARYKNMVLEEELRLSLAKLPDPYEEDPRLSLVNLLFLCDAGIRLNTNIPEDKASRWIGFLQGCLCMRGTTTVDIERDFTRPLFLSVYGVKIERVERKDTWIHTATGNKGQSL